MCSKLLYLRLMSLGVAFAQTYDEAQFVCYLNCDLVIQTNKMRLSSELLIATQI